VTAEGIAVAQPTDREMQENDARMTMTPTDGVKCLKAVFLSSCGLCEL